MEFHKTESYRNDIYRDAVHLINCSIPENFPSSDELWKKLGKLLFKGNSTSIVGQRIRAITRQVDFSESQLSEQFWDYLSTFTVHYLSDNIVFGIQLENIYQHNPEPGDAFLHWLLFDYLRVIIKEYKNQVYRESVVEATQEEIYWDSQSTGEDEPISLPPDSYERDKAERTKNTIAFSRNNVVQLALIGISQKMSKKNWKNETQFKQPGLQMYPFLYDKSIPMEAKEADLLQQLGENVENYVSELHGTQKSFCPASYLAEVHDQASRQLTIIRQKWEERIHNTRNYSSRRRNEMRKGIKIIADTWLTPLDNSLVAEVCKVDIRYADQLLSRYKKDFLSEIYHVVNNYREDKDV